MSEKFVKIKEAAEILGVSKLTLRNWDNSGKLTAFRHPINNYRVYKNEDIENLIKMIKPKEKTKNIIKEVSTQFPTQNSKEKQKTYTLKVIHLKD